MLPKGNILYGFQFLKKKNATSGIVFNSVGVNGLLMLTFKISVAAGRVKAGKSGCSYDFTGNK